MTTATNVSIGRRDAQLNDMILQGDALEAFDKFYAENVVMQDQGMGPWEGKDENREREKAFFDNVTELRSFELIDTGIGDDVTFSTWHLDFTHEEWGDVTYKQVAVRHWNDEGLVVKERFYRG